MPYFVTDQSADCNGWATIKQDGEVIGCHNSKEDAIAQMIAVSLAEGIEPGGDYLVARVLPDNYRPALENDVPEGRACGNCVFYNEAKVEGDKAYCEKWDEYVSGGYYCNAWQADEERAVYEVPDYIRNAAARGLSFVEDGLAGDGLQAQTISEARELAAGRADTDKVIRMAAWIRRHRGDWEGVPQNEDQENEDFPGPGAVAGFLWGVETTDRDATDRVLSWADALIAAEDREIIDMKEKETRSLPIGEYRLAEADADGQRTFSGYAAIWNSASAGLPFEERIAPSAFKRSLARASAGQKIISFLFGHDETRALATTASGRLQLTEDETGLRVEAKLDPADPDAAKVISMLTHESAAAGMSFGFQKVQDAWDGNQRTIKEANLFEVSILAAGGQTPAYPATLGLTAIRQVTAPKIGVEAEALMATLESVKAGRELSTEEVAVIDAVRSKLAPKQEKVVDPSVAMAMLALEAAEGDAL
jgi:HK97 family phage prohead protease